jgi:hypothetical protein
MTLSAQLLVGIEILGKIDLDGDPPGREPCLRPVSSFVTTLLLNLRATAMNCDALVLISNPV